MKYGYWFLLAPFLFACESEDKDSALPMVNDTAAVNIVDADGDGHDSISDCDDSDPATFPGAPEICDGKDNDCDDLVDEDLNQTYYSDADGDGYGDPASPTEACQETAGLVLDDTDCDDGDPDVNVAAIEECDGIDNNCNGSIDEGLLQGPWYADLDADGFGDDADAVLACEVPSGRVSEAGDCDDSNPEVNPAAEETCNELDDNCDGQVDEGFSKGPWFLDSDGDGFGDEDLSVESCDAPSGYVESSGDCDDSLSDVNPDAEEFCDERDNDCDGVVDEDFYKGPWYLDSDSDGYGQDDATMESCGMPSGYSEVGGDCDDGDATVSPDAIEVCDGVDNDCDGDTDEYDSEGASPWYADDDGDGYGDPDDMVMSCDSPLGRVNNSADCDDSNPRVNPDATEICDESDTDQNCNGLSDDDDPTLDSSGVATFYVDADGDGFGDPSGATVESCDPPSGMTAVGDDCNDSDSDVFPGAIEWCDGTDNDCDGTIDEDEAADATTWYPDEDGDGYGTWAGHLDACDQPDGFASEFGDCDDSDPDANPESGCEWDTADTAPPFTREGDYSGQCTISLNWLGVLEDTCTVELLVTVDESTSPEITGSGTCTFTGSFSLLILGPQDVSIQGSVEEDPYVSGNLTMSTLLLADWSGLYSDADTLEGSFDGTYTLAGILEVDYWGSFAVER